MHTPPLRRYRYFKQWPAGTSPLPSAGRRTGNALPVLLPPSFAGENRQAVRAQPQRDRLPYPQVHTAAL